MAHVSGRVQTVSALRVDNPDLIAALFEAQSVKQCRVVTHRPPQSYCELTCGHNPKYHGHKAHEFDGAITCESCKHMGRRYWGSDDRPIHHCDRSAERRRANFRSTGNFGDDFMQEFRRFYDAGPHQWAEACGYFEPREIPNVGVQP